VKRTAQIFLCYAKEDKPQVEQLYGTLKQAGFAPWMDKVDLMGGVEWRPTIQNAIKQAHFFVACVSRHWVPTNPNERKRFFRREIQTALDVLPELPSGDIFIIPIRLDECEVPESLSLFQWIDYFQQDGWERLLKAIHTQMVKLGLMRPLRSKPEMLSTARVILMLREFNFFDRDMNPSGNGIKHEYEHRGELVFDRATDLVWQQNGSKEQMSFTIAKKYVHRLNREEFEGFSDWRLPTLEEAMSLMEPSKKNCDLHIDPIFDNTQRWIWTADKESYSVVWYADFGYGPCSINSVDRYIHYVRAVRSGQ